MCISFGNPSEPCCGGNLAGRLAIDSTTQIEILNVWNVLPDGYTETRVKRARDITLRVVPTVNKQNGLRIGNVDVNIPAFPERTATFLSVEASAAQFLNRDNVAVDLRTYQRRMFLQKTGSFAGVWTPDYAGATDDNFWFSQQFNYYPKAGFPALDPHRWLQTKQIRLTFPGVSTNIKGYFEPLTPEPEQSDTVLVLSAAVLSEQRARTIDRNAVGICIPAIVTGYNGPDTIAYGTAFHALGTMHCKIEENPEFQPSQAVTPENYPTRIKVNTDDTDKSSAFWLPVQGIVNVSSIAWDANDSSRGTVTWRVQGDGSPTATGRIWVQHIAPVPQDEKRPIT